MRLLLLSMLTSLSFSTYAQKEIKLEDVGKHVGDSVTVKGFIKGIRYVETAKNSPTFLNIGAPYPNQLLTIVIWGDDRKKIGFDLSEKSVGGLAIVTGKVELYRDKPQIVVTNPSQLRILIDEEVPATQIPPIEKKN